MGSLVQYQNIAFLSNFFVALISSGLVEAIIAASIWLTKVLAEADEELELKLSNPDDEKEKDDIFLKLFSNLSKLNFIYFLII